jgi:hypothetical protein
MFLSARAWAEGPPAATAQGAKGKKTKAKAAGKDQSASKGQLPPDDTGKLRSIEVHQPKVNDKAPPSGEAQERTAHDNAPTTAPPPMDEDLARERVTKAMRRYQKAIDACIDAARKRTPAANGQIDLLLQISERKVAPTVSKDTSGDAQLGSCLLQAARSWELPAASLTMPWVVSLTH